MEDHFYAVIMAGGGGTRLWPLSRTRQPKQMLHLTGPMTLFQMAVDRLKGLFESDHILVVTIAEQASLLKEQCPQIPPENFLIEPMPRGTASVVGLAALALQERDPQAIMVVLTADHYIENINVFQGILKSAALAAMDGYLVTLGIHPTYAATGYGYVQRGEVLGSYQDRTAYRVAMFKEKPDEASAREFLKHGDHDWNSGMFIWRVDRILEEFSTHMPELASLLGEIQQAWGTPQGCQVLQNVWPKIQPQTIDYGIMEKASQVAVLPAAELGWNDIGSWESLFDVLDSDSEGNIIIQANHIGLETHSSLICSQGSDRLVVTIGIQDLVVVDTQDALLICSRSQAQKVRDLVNILKQTHQTQYL